MFDFRIVTTWFGELLRVTCGLSNSWTVLIECVAVGLAILLAYASLTIVLVFMEREVCAYFQYRIGPVRIGWWGTLQVFTDILKMLIKEIFVVDKADRLLYYLAPFLVIIASVGTLPFLPWNKGAYIPDFNVGTFLVTAISSIGVIGVFIAGWGNNNKYSALSAMRGAVQVISYELSLGICLISAVILTSTMQISGIVEAQTGPLQWSIVQGHVPATLAFLTFCVAGNAEANRDPFDPAETESELTAGYHTEYDGMGFGSYYLAEYPDLFVIAGIATIVFLGGQAPLNIGLDGPNTITSYIPGLIWFLGKTFTVVFLLMWIKWTFPRLRVDQILKSEWKYLTPLSLVILVLTTVCVALGWTVHYWWLKRIEGKKQSCFGEIGNALKTPATGMKVTMKEYFTPKPTEQYPENHRTTPHVTKRHRGRLVFKRDEEKNHKCTACAMCEKARPSGTTKILPEMVTNGETGKEKRQLVDYEYDLGDCMFCELCVNACNFDAIEFTNDSENTVFDRSRLILHLDKEVHEGGSLPGPIDGGAD